MSLYAEIGTIVRALPNEDGMQIKLQTPTGSRIMHVPANRPELVSEAREARMSGVEVMVRRTEHDMVVALRPNTLLQAA